MNADDFIGRISCINEKIKQGMGLVDSQLIDEFDSKYRILQDSIQDIEIKERNLRIGVVGAVKAGKSTFLNSLLFKGENILPKAPTPMTAALTRVRYAEKPSAKIFFYSRQEWNRIKKKADEYNGIINDKLKEEEEQYNRLVSTQAASLPMGGNTVYSVGSAPTFKSVEEKYKGQISLELRSCNELVKMLDETPSVSEYLDKGEIAIADTEHFDEKVNEYVGAEGRFTPIVKYMELAINNELLKDLEIVDTPGLNDPILSRSKKTSDFLLQCDVIFVLSYTGQFLTSEDMALINRTLPQEGIRHAVIIATKFDSGLLDYSKRNARFIDAFKHTRSILNKAAESRFVPYGRRGDSSADVLAFKTAGVMATSGLLFSAARKIEAGRPLDEEEDHVIRTLKKRFPDFDNSAAGLYELSGMEEIQQKVLRKIRENKNEIVKKRVGEFQETQQNRFIKLLEEINLDLRRNLNDINQYEYGTLQEKAKKLSRNLDSVRRAIHIKFSDAAIDAQKHIQRIISEVDEEMENHRYVMLGEKEEKDTTTLRSGLFGWMRQEVYEIKRIKTVETNTVVENMKQYCSRIHQIIIQSFDNLIDMEGLKRDVKNKVQGAFDTTDKDFDPDEIAIVLNKAIGSLTVPKISLNRETYVDMLLSRFPEVGIIEGENEIAELKMQQSIVLQKIFEDAKAELESKSSALENELNRCAGEFVDNIERQMLEQIRIVQGLLSDKEESINKLERYKEVIAECKQGLCVAKMST